MAVAPEYIGSRTGYVLNTQRNCVVLHPADTQPGDLIVAWVTVTGTSTTGTLVTFNTPPGWTLVEEIANQSGRTGDGMAVLVGFAGSETSISYSYNTSSGNRVLAVAVHAYRGVDPSNPIDASAIAFSKGTIQSTFPTPSVTTTTGDCIVVRGFCGTVSGTRTNQSWPQSTKRTEWAYTTTTYRPHVGTADRVRPTPGATGTEAATASNYLNDIFGFALAIRPLSNLDVADSDASDSAIDSASLKAKLTPFDTGSATEPATQKISVTLDPDAGTTADALQKLEATTPPTTDAGGPAADSITKLTAIVRPTADEVKATESAVARFTARGDDQISIADAVQQTEVQLPLLTEPVGTADNLQKLEAKLTPPGEAVSWDGEDARATFSAKGDDAISAADNTSGPIGSRTQQPDTGLGTETQKVTGTAPATGDASTAFDSASTTGTSTASDASQPAAETQRLTIRASDSMSANDTASTRAKVTVVDSYQGADASSIGPVVDPDTGEWNENAYKAVSGVLDTPRLLTIARESRIVLIAREPRTRTIQPEARKVIFGKDLAARSKMPHPNGRSVGVRPEIRRVVVRREE